MTPAEKAAIVVALSKSARDMMLAGITRTAFVKTSAAPARRRSIFDELTRFATSTA